MSVQATFAATLADEWAELGVTDAVVCPGSRSTPLALALARRLRVHVRLDERSAGFYALGRSLASGRATVICTTSGTAAAELHPAVVEAHQGRVPLIVCTADRPPELHHVGASQTIDQIGLFTTATRWASTPGVPEAGQEASWRPLAARALAEAERGPLGPGPVHLNLAFREPLIGSPDPLPAGGGPALMTAPLPAPVLAAPLSGRGLIIAGDRATADPQRVVRLGHRLGWPVLADPRSGCRLERTIAAADAIVRADIPRPETVLLLGGPWLSKALGEYVSAAAADGARVIAVDPWWQWVDPSHVVGEMYHADPDAWMVAALESAVPADPAWLGSWLHYEAAAQSAISETLGLQLSEPLVAQHLARHAAAAEATILVSASMPMRDLEWFAPALVRPPAVKANRGANGIDGVVSTALGLAASGRRTFALLGDLAFLHDVSGLVNLAELPCTFVVLDNNGGGIFSFLPQAAALDDDQFELLFGTPPTSDVGAVARGFGLAVDEVTTLAELEAALHQPAPNMIRVKVPGRADNVTLHNAVNQAVRLALG
ncbi:MAG TPA: 2-succinyl-5-enolpyruvyl-6-hydroxy-3-cyclohexene-1-carboxylic-acid synthase [Acidimicrobiales bacterium]|nr:2-succinyl-5-enolpyruvyl-6-hydroxy-3-cyclohexene-1-carboxylic-acid synthase [Acidimicrobiales bacterium]